MKTPNHLENATKVIEAGKDLFIEWPAGRGLKETKLLAELAKEKGIRSLVGLQARQNVVFCKVKKLVEGGEIGDVLSTSMVHRSSVPRIALFSFMLDITNIRSTRVMGTNSVCRKRIPVEKG